MDEKTCVERMKKTEEKIKAVEDRHDRRLDSHSDRIKELEQYRSRTEVQMETLIDQVKELVKSNKAFMASVFALLAGFLFWYIQKL